MLFKFLNILLLVGAVQGIAFTTIILASKRFKDRSNFFLAMFILALSLNNLQYFFFYSNIISHKLFYHVFYIPYAPIIIVFYYFYVKTFLYPSKAIHWKENLLYLPFLFFLLAGFVYKIGDSAHLLSTKAISFLDLLLRIVDIFGLIYSIFLLLYCYLRIKAFEKEQKLDRGNVLKININWLNNSSLLFFLLCFFYFFAVWQDLFATNSNDLYYYLLWVAISVFIYILGHIGLYKFGVIQERKKIKKYFSEHPTSPGEPSRSRNKHIREFEGFVKTEKNYLDNQLSLNMVASHLGINPSYLSRLISSELDTNFADYVNRLRVEEAKIYIKNPDFENYTLIAIGLEAGFNSKSVFYSAFKKHTGVSPSRFK